MMLRNILWSWKITTVTIWLLLILVIDNVLASKVFLVDEAHCCAAAAELSRLPGFCCCMIEPVFQNKYTRFTTLCGPDNKTSLFESCIKYSPCQNLNDVKKDPFKAATATYDLVCGGCFFITWILSCPCAQRRKKLDEKTLSVEVEATSNSTSISLNEGSAGGSFSSRSRNGIASQSKSLPRIQGGRHFTLAELSKATRKFSPTCKIGQGGFGAVYKGTLSDGTVVAVKRAKKKVYDPRVSNEFETEVLTLMNIDHLNLVKLIGYLEEEDERILIVEYVPNGNLREHLDGSRGIILDLGMRVDICIDVSHALTYLHMYAGNPIIHRDVKPSNILLTEKFRAKVADFGYSRMGPQEFGDTHVSTQVKGTAGYLDPEYLKKFQLTEKSDVYSFGVILLEVITGRRPIDEKREVKEKILSKWAFRKFLDGKITEILDPRLEKSNAALVVVERISELAFQCTAPSKQDRPCMKNVAEILWDIRKTYLKLTQEGRPATAGKRPQNLASLNRNSMPARPNITNYGLADLGKKFAFSQSYKDVVVPGRS